MVFKVSGLRDALFQGNPTDRTVEATALRLQWAGGAGCPPPTLTHQQAAPEEPSVGPTTADRRDCPEPSQHRTQQETLGNRRAYDRTTPPNTPTPKGSPNGPLLKRGCALPNTCMDNAERQLQDHQGPRAEA